MIYNALPHFSDPDRLIGALSAMLKPGGVLSIAHGMSREKINDHHSGSAKQVSLGLMPAADLAKLCQKYLKIETVIDDEVIYQIVGKKD